MRLQDIMQRQVETISPEASVVSANEQMWRKQIHHLVVVNGQRQVVGVISDTDLGGSRTDHLPADKQVKHYMTTDVVTESPTATVDRAINLFRHRQIHCLPVVSDGCLVGMVTDADIHRLVHRGRSQPPFRGNAAGGPYPPLHGLRQDDAWQRRPDDSSTEPS